MEQTGITEFVTTLTDAFRDGDPMAAEKAVEARNVERLQSLYRALARGDFAAAADAMTEDVSLEIRCPPAFGFINRARGRGEAVTAMRVNFSKVEDQKPEIVSLVAQGNTIVVIAREQGRHRASGKPYDVHWTQLFEFRDGKIARFREYSDQVAGFEGS